MNYIKMFENAAIKKWESIDKENVEKQIIIRIELFKL